MDLQIGNGLKNMDIKSKNLCSLSPNTSAPQASSGVAENIKNNADIILAENLGAPSPIPSNATAPQGSSVAADVEGSINFTNKKVLRKARNAKQRRRAFLIVKMAKRKIHKARRSMLTYDREKKLIQEEKEAIKEQIKEIDEKLDTLGNTERSALLSLERYQDIMSRFDELEQKHESCIGDQHEHELCMAELEDLIELIDD